MAAIEDILGVSEVVKNDGSVGQVKDLCAGKLVGIYFSAHWCPPCRNFTPVLSELYKKSDKNFVVIFISSDRDEASFNEYFNSMPWYAVKFSDLQSKKQAISSKYSVSGIPKLVILKDNGEEITREGRNDVAKSPEELPASWKQ